MRRKILQSRVVGLLAGMAIFAGIVHILNVVYVPNAGGELNGWSRFVLHHFYEDDENIDCLYLGSSHLYCDIDPCILDQLSGEHHFNLGSAGQSLNASYYLLREADRLNDLSHVYLEMYHGCSLSDGNTKGSQNWNVLDYMKPSFNKAAYLISYMKPAASMDGLYVFPFTRNREYLGDWDYVRDRAEDKAREDYRNYQWTDGTLDQGWYQFTEQGFFDRIPSTTYEEWLKQRKICRQDRILSSCVMGKENERYLRRIIEYCQKRDISITLFISPMDDLQLISTLDYDDWIAEVRRFADEYGIPFYDFNLVRDEYLALRLEKHFRDTGHLHRYGAEKFTPFFYQVVTGEETDNRIYFYDSWQEKIQDHAALYGIYYCEEESAAEEQNVDTTMWIASSFDEHTEYRIVFTPEEGERYLIRDYTEDKEFQVSLPKLDSGNYGLQTITVRNKDTEDKEFHMSLPKLDSGDYGLWTITARNKDSLEELQTLEIIY